MSTRILTVLALLLVALPAQAQVRERPVAFDSAGRITSITPPLAARLGLSAPLWPVTGDYLDARLYALDDSSRQFVIVVRRPREAVDRYSLDGPARSALGAAIDRGNAMAIAVTGLGADSMPTFISEPVRGAFVLSQTMLGLALFGPAAAAITEDGAAGTAAYLAVSGGAFFLAAELTRSSSVSRAQNHLAQHSAVRGAIAGNLALFALAGDNVGDRGVAAVTLAGGVLGDIIGFQLARPMTDAEAHGTSHGSTFGAVLTTGLLGTTGLIDDDGMARAGAALIIVGGALGYPAGLRYVRKAPYRVTAGDVGTVAVTEILGVAAVATLLPESNVSVPVAFGALTAGYVAGALVGDRLLVRPLDHTESEARLFAFGTLAGALIGLAGPILAESENTNIIFGSMTVGGILGAILTQNLIQPAKAGTNARMGSRGAAGSSSRVAVRFSPESALLAATRQRGSHSIVSLVF